MAAEKRGLKSVRTMGCLVDRRRTRSSPGALMELSVLANEKQRLEQERERCLRRSAEIGERLAEIADKECRLYRFVKEPTPPPQPVRPAGEPGQRLRATEIRY